MEFRKVVEGPPPPVGDVEAMSSLADRLREQDAPVIATTATSDIPASGRSAAAGPIAVKVPAEVRLARYLWAAEYHASGLGMVDWWLSLDQGRKDFASAVLRSIMA